MTQRRFLEEEMVFEVRFAGCRGRSSVKSTLRILRNSIYEGRPGGRKERPEGYSFQLVTSALSSQTCYESYVSQWNKK